MTAIVVTGMPGCGKTAYVVAELMKMIKAGRPVFADGIPELTLPHNPLPPVDQWTKYVDDPSSATGKKLVYDFPPNAVIVLDECQRHFRVRSAGQKVPEAVAALETHRHQGLDFFLITQHPNLLDTNLRRLCRHIHLRNTPLGRRLYEWPEVNDPDSRAARQLSAARRYKLPKEAFQKYKSAELHTKSRERLPMAAYAFGFGVVAIVAGAGYGYHRYNQIFKPDAKKLEVKTETSSQVSAVQPADLPAPGQSISLTSDAAWNETRPGHPETAPAYAGLLQVQAKPWPAMCMEMKGDCRCYTEQATRLRTITPERCREILTYGEFDPYRAPQVQATGAAQASAGSPQASTPAGAESGSAPGLLIASNGTGPQLSARAK